MTSKDGQDRTVFSSEGARRVLGDGGKDLTDDERALLMAFAQVDVSSGVKLDEEARAVLSELQAGLEDYDADELTQAIDQMVKAKPSKGQQLDWSELKRSRRKKSPRKKS